MGATILVWFWAAGAIVVLAIAIYRNLKGIHGNVTFHVLGPQVQQEARTIVKLEAIERWGQFLTLVVVVYGLVLAFAYLWLQVVGPRIR